MRSQLIIELLFSFASAPASSPRRSSPPLPLARYYSRELLSVKSTVEWGISVLLHLLLPPLLLLLLPPAYLPPPRTLFIRGRAVLPSCRVLYAGRIRRRPPNDGIMLVPRAHVIAAPFCTPSLVVVPPPPPASSAVPNSYSNSPLLDGILHPLEDYTTRRFSSARARLINFQPRADVTRPAVNRGTRGGRFRNRPSRNLYEKSLPSG